MEEDRYKSNSTCTMTTTTTTRHMLGKHSAREDFPVLIFSRVPFRLVAVNARSLSLSLIRERLPAYIRRAVKTISIFDSCSTKRSPRIYRVQTPYVTYVLYRKKGSPRYAHPLFLSPRNVTHANAT